MLNENQLITFQKTLQRIFTLPVTRSTFREIHNAIMAITQGNQEEAQRCLETLLTGNSANGDTWKAIVENYSIPAWVAKEVFEKGDFLSLITSDILTKADKVIFSSQFKRVDGEELQLITDPESTLQLLQHFTNRVQEAAQAKGQKDSFKKYSSVFKSLSKQLDAIAKTLEPNQ